MTRNVRRRLCAALTRSSVRPNALFLHPRARVDQLVVSFVSSVAVAAEHGSAAKARRGSHSPRPTGSVVGRPRDSTMICESAH